MDTETNLLHLLHKWARRHDENFLTEAFAHLLNYFAQNRRSMAGEMIRRMTGERLLLRESDLVRLTITTQNTIEGKRPDMELATPNSLVYVEAKVGSKLRPKQLRNYRVRLNRNKAVDQKYLILLTRDDLRDAVSKLPGDATPDCTIQWIEVAEWLDSAAPNYLSDDRIGLFLTDQFTTFLASRSMAVKKVSPYFPEGLQSLRSLLLMVVRALSACGLKSKDTPAPGYLGFNCDQNGHANKYWVGVDFEWPCSLFFETNEMALDKKIPGRLGLGGEVYKESGTASHYVWSVDFDLSSDNAAFYQASAAEQNQLIKEFLKDCLEKIRRIETAQAK